MLDQKRNMFERDETVFILHWVSYVYKLDYVNNFWKQ